MLTVLHQEVSVQTHVFHQQVADRLKLTASDVKCLSLLHHRGQEVVSALACELQLTQSAVTSVLDKLEAAGYILRERSPVDRRRVVVRLIPEHAQDYFECVQDVHERTEKLLERHTLGQIRQVLDFTAQIKMVVVEANERLKNQPKVPL